MAYTFTIHYKNAESEHNEFVCYAADDKAAIEKFKRSKLSAGSTITRIDQKKATSVYQIVTERLLEEMQKGVIPWHRPWHGIMDGAVSYDTQRPYSFLNQLLLGKPGEWLTRNSIHKHGGRIKKGAKAGLITFWKTYLADKDGNEVEEGSEAAAEKRWVLRYYHAYHIDDTEGIESKLAKKANPGSGIQPIEVADRVIQGYISRNRPLRLEIAASNKACYSPMRDVVTVPLLEQFDVPEQFYGTLFHELGHSTGHKDRLDRKSGMAGHFGDPDYAKEELVAELTSAMVCDHLEFECDKAFKNTVAYLQNWMSALKNDERLIIYAAAKAEAAAKYILNIKEAGEGGPDNNGSN